MVRTVAMVVNYGTPDDLWRLIASAERHDPGMEWRIWDNAHPKVDSLPMLISLKNRLGSRLTTIRSATNAGHGRGINGLASSEILSSSVRPPFHFIVNPDCEWTEPIIERLEGFLDEHPDVIAVGPKQVDTKWGVTAGGIIGASTSPKHRGWKEYDPSNVKYRDTILDCPTIAGSAMLVRAFPWSSPSADGWCVGGMLESSHYYSETWPCYHARAHGWKVAYFGEPWMVHKWHQSTPVGSPLSDGLFNEDRELFRQACDQHNPPIERD